MQRENSLEDSGTIEYRDSLDYCQNWGLLSTGIHWIE